MLKNSLTIEKYAYLFIFTIVATGVISSRTNPEFYKIYVTEDGFVESLTVLGLLFAGVLCFYRLFRLRAIKPLHFSYFLGLIGLIFLFGFGEEISWGERIFDFGAISFFKTHNAQGELNLHNLVFNGVKINKLVFGKILGLCVVLYLLPFPLMYRKIGWLRRKVDALAIPVPRNHQVIAYFILLALVSLDPSPKKGELLEFAGCAMLFLIVLNPVNGHIYSKERRGSASPRRRQAGPDTPQEFRKAS